MKRSTLTIAWVFLGILAVAAAITWLAKSDRDTDPRVDSFGPSGLSAFAYLLRTNGYRVDVDTSFRPHLDKGDVAIVLLNEQHAEPIDAQSSGVYSSLATFAEHGGSLLILPLNEVWADNLGKVDKISADNLIDGKQFTLKGRPVVVTDGSKAYLPNDLVSATLLEEHENSLKIATLSKYGKGFALYLYDGFLATNHYIDQERNADAVMGLTRTLAAPGSRVVFIESSFAGEPPGLLEILGPAASAAWYQLLFLFVVIVYTLGKRFGLAEWSRPKQLGQRDLVEAIADSYGRAHATRAACRSAYDRADHDVRKALKLSAEAPASERDSRVPGSLAVEFRRVFEGTIDSLSPHEAFERCRGLQRQVKRFLNRDS